MSLAGVVLAGGIGSRLAPLTSRVPKPLLRVGGRSLLSRQVAQLRTAGAETIYVTLHHQAAKVARHLEREAPGVVYRIEPELTGPAGALLLLADLLGGCEAVLVASCDVLVGDGLAGLAAARRDDDAALTFGAAATAGARHYGVLDVGPDGALSAAREKPDVPDHEVHLVSAGVYCMRSDVIETIGRLANSADTVDYARDLAPDLLAAGERVTAHRLGGYWRDVGTPASLMAARRDAREGRIPPLSGLARRSRREARPALGDRAVAGVEVPR